MPIKAKTMKVLMVTAVGALTFQTAGAQGARTSGTAADSNMSNVAKTLRAAAAALNMVRMSDIGAGDTRLPGVDVVNTMQVWGSGTTYRFGRGPATAYHVAFAYNPPAMRVEMTTTSPDGGPPQHTIQVVREKYAWDESEIGGGLVPGKGTATPVRLAVKDRLLMLWTLPYGVVKAAVAAGDKTRVSTASGVTIISFPLSGELAGVSVKATLDVNNFVSRVETQADNPALDALVTETEYSDYADHGEIQTDIKSPDRILRKQHGSPVLDIQIKTWDANNPYLVFPVPASVKTSERF
jgi:hypothetical protein